MHSDEKSQKRVEKLFSDLEQIANQPAEKGSSPPVTNEAPESPPANDISIMSSEMDGLIARILEMEAKVEESETRAAAAEANLAAAKAEKEKAAPAPTMVYEKEEIGYTYRDEKASPLQMNAASENIENVIGTPLTASGEIIGDIKIQPPAEREWTNDEESLASAVAQQASLQIQNLRLLAANDNKN